MTIGSQLAARAAVSNFGQCRASPNYSFKPIPLRGTACVPALRLHAFAATARDGLTQVLGGMKESLLLRLIVTEPLPGVHTAMQCGKLELLPPTVSSGTLTFDFPVFVDLATDPPRLTGEFTQGPPAKRFVYINSGSYAGQPGTCWSRRAKVPITGITASLAAKAVATNCVLQASVLGVAKDGGPFCASVPLLSDWRVVSAA